MSIKHFNRLLIQTIARQQSHISRVRLYGRWMHRNPVKVLLPFEPTSNVNLKKEKVISLDPGIVNKSEEHSQHAPEIGDNGNTNKDSQDSISTAKYKEIKSKKEDKMKKRKFYLGQQKIFDDNNEIIYEKLKDNDGRVSTLLTNLKSKKGRLHTQQMLVEGWRLIVDGLEAKCKLNYVIFSRVEDLNNLRPFLPKTGIKFFKIPYKEINLWSDVETSPGLFGEPHTQRSYITVQGEPLLEAAVDRIPKQYIFDKKYKIQLFEDAYEGLKSQEILVFTDGSKTNSGIFEMPMSGNVRRLSKPLPLDFVCDNIRVPGNLGAILRVAVGAGCEKVLLTKGCVDVWDPKVLRSAAGAHFRLPIHNSIDWEDMPQHLEEPTSIFIADSNAKITEDEEVDDKFEALQIPVLPYYGVQYSTLHHITLVIGGETEGISEESYRLAANRNGLRLNIPLSRGIDSLNTGMAAAIIAFEIRKQLLQAWSKLKQDRILAENQGT